MASTIDLGLVKGPTGPKGDTGPYNPGKISIGNYEYNGFTVQYNYTYYTNFSIDITIRIDTTVEEVKSGESGISLGTIPVSYTYPKTDCYLYGLYTPFLTSDIEYNCVGIVDSNNRLTLYSLVSQSFDDHNSISIVLRGIAPANTYSD